MSDPEASPEVLHDDHEHDHDHDEEQVDIEGDVEAEELVDDDEVDVDGDGDGDVEEEEDEEEDEDKQDGQEGLDLDMAEEEGGGYQDEHETDHEAGAGNGAQEVKAVEEEVDAIDAEDVVHAEEEKQPLKDDGEKSKELLTRPPHGSEVFVGGITRDTTEEDLRSLCSSCGDIYEVRLLKDKDTGQNKGYAFVTFTNKESAEKAIESLSDSELKGKKLRFSHSQSKHRLFVGNIPKAWDKDELEKVLAEQGPGIQSVELLKDPKNPSRNRGFAFVEYYNHACADHARRVMSNSSFRLGSNAPTISWADPRSGSDSSAMSQQVKVVYVRNLPDTVTEEQLQKLFEHHGEVTKVVLPAPKPGQAKRDFGFVHFAERSSALKAIEKSERYELEGRWLETSLAKPPAEKRPAGLEPAYPPQRAGLLPQYQTRVNFGYAADMYGAVAAGYGQARGYSQPVIYGRGPPPAGMTMVPMMLPDGRIGYVLQQPGPQGGSAPYRQGGGGGGGGGRMGGHGILPNRQGGGSGGGAASASGGRRYRPY